MTAITMILVMEREQIRKYCVLNFIPTVAKSLGWMNFYFNVLNKYVAWLILIYIVIYTLVNVFLSLLHSSTLRPSENEKDTRQKADD